MLEHVWKYDKDYFTAADVDLITFSFHPSLTIGNDAVLDVEIHLIFGFKEQTANQLSVFRFHFNDSTFRVVQDNNWNPDAIVAYDGHILIKIVSNLNLGSTNVPCGGSLSLFAIAVFLLR